ncbi:MAG: hypothetical protein P1U86_14310 [Verrucomicrobiales bacterium]|nr:hypothetical protein [Verrucomicrobiales bacterium]
MNLEGLRHLSRSARILADDCSIVVLGSASLLCTFPNLGDPDQPLENTFDADLCPEPFDETTGRMLNEALGESNSFHLRHGYHADILRPEIFETLPNGWRERLVPVPSCEETFGLDPHDLAATKILVGRDKDKALVGWLWRNKLIDSELVEERLRTISKSEKAIIRSSKTFREVFERI